MTPEQLDEIEKLAEAATPGPWKTVIDELINLRDESHTDSGAHQVALHDCFSEQDAEKNAALITTMREQALPMVKALREAWESVEEWRKCADERQESFAFWFRAANDTTKERDEARAEVERLREVVKNSFTLGQITETVLKAIDEITRDPTPMPRRPRRLETKVREG